MCIRDSQRHGKNNHRLAGNRDEAEIESLVPEGRVAKAFGAKKQQTQAGHGEMHADRNDQQHQGRRRFE